MRSQSKEDYLKAIYLIQEQQNGAPASTSNLASMLGVANASVTAMLKRFASADPRLVDYEPYGGAALTADGKKAALEVIRHHRLIESFLSQVLGYTWDEVHDEAERLEHVISEDMEDRIALALGDPHIDPHGDPIPDREGNLRLLDAIPLTRLPENIPATIERITGQESELLRYLAGLGLTLSTRVEVVSKAPFNGPLSITIQGDHPATFALGHEVTDKILVSPIAQAVVREVK